MTVFRENLQSGSLDGQIGLYKKCSTRCGYIPLANGAAFFVSKIFF